MATVLEVLQGIRQSDISRVLGGVLDGEGGDARADTLMKYMYVKYYLSTPFKSDNLQLQGNGWSILIGDKLDTKWAIITTYSKGFGDIPSRHRIQSDTRKESW